MKNFLLKIPVARSAIVFSSCERCGEVMSELLAYGYNIVSRRAIVQKALVRMSSRTINRFTSTLASEASGGRRALFFGTDRFAVAVLRGLIAGSGVQVSTEPDEHHNRFELLDAVCLPQTSNRHDFALRQFCQTNGIVAYNYTDTFRPKLNHYDVGIVASFGRLIPESIIEAFPFGLINVHPSLLPRWRGSSPLQHTILNGDRETGVTLFLIEPHQFDVGRIIAQSSVEIDGQPTAHQLGEQLAALGAEMLLETMCRLEERVGAAWSQPHTGVCNARRISPSGALAYVDWSESASSIHQRYRALSDYFPLRAIWEGQTVKLYRMRPVDFDVDGALDRWQATQRKLAPGYLFFHRRRDVLCVRCGEADDESRQCYIGVERLGLPGRRTMSARDFYNGFLSKGGLYSDCFQSSSRCPAAMDEPIGA